MMCTGITNIRTITNKKLQIPKNKMGLNKTIDRILEDYLSGFSAKKECDESSIEPVSL
jgi:hypothetical protein